MYTQHLEYEPLGGGALRAVLTLSFPDGTTERFAEVVTPTEMADVGRSYAQVEGIAGLCEEIGAAARRVRDYTIAQAANASYDGLTKAEKAGRSVQQWWDAIGKDGRVSTRASFAAILAEIPNYTLAEARAWWGKLGKDGRVRMREKHTKGYGETFLDDVYRTVKPIVNTAASTFEKVPVYGQIIAPQIRAGAEALRDPKVLLATSLNSMALPVATNLPAFKKVASAKVLDAAAKRLTVKGGSPIKLGAGNVLAVSSRLAAADVAADFGATGAARKIVQNTKAAIAKATAGKPGAKAALMKQALSTRTKLNKLTDAGKRDPVAAARAGKLRSNRGGAVTSAQLAKAVTEGRVFWLEA